MEIEQKRVVWPWVAAGVGGVLLVAGIVFGVMWWMKTAADDELEAPTSSVPELPKEPKIVSVSGKILFTGNLYWSRYINQISSANAQGIAYPFSGWAELQRENYTDWIGGLECPVTDKGGMHNRHAEYELLLFNCYPDYLPEFKKWFSIVSLGNNHTDNQGVAGFAETKEHLSNSGVQYFGHYSPLDTAEVCNVVKITTFVKYDDGEEKSGALPIAMCGYHGVVERAPTLEVLAVMAEYAKVMPVVQMPHMGVEYQAKSSPLRERVYREMIDVGADMVLGDHPHWVQNSEAYNGKLIVYSMGNFLFDQYFEEDVKRGAAIAGSFSASDAEGWNEWVDECVEGGLAVCAEITKREKLKRYSLEWEYDVVATYHTDRITHLASESVREAVLQRLDWAKTLGGLR